MYLALHFMHCTSTLTSYVELKQRFCIEQVSNNINIPYEWKYWRVENLAFEFLALF